MEAIMTNTKIKVPWLEFVGGLLAGFLLWGILSIDIPNKNVAFWFYTITDLLIIAGCYTGAYFLALRRNFRWATFLVGVSIYALLEILGTVLDKII